LAREIFALMMNCRGNLNHRRRRNIGNNLPGISVAASMPVKPAPTTMTVYCPGESGWPGSAWIRHLIYPAFWQRPQRSTVPRNHRQTLEFSAGSSTASNMASRRSCRPQMAGRPSARRPMVLSQKPFRRSDFARNKNFRPDNPR
jgi:hypothetical protein